MSHGVNTVGLYVRDQDEALVFYVEKLGFKVHTDARNGNYKYLARSGGRIGEQFPEEVPYLRQDSALNHSLIRPRLHRYCEARHASTS